MEIELRDIKLSELKKNLKTLIDEAPCEEYLALLLYNFAGALAR